METTELIVFIVGVIICLCWGQNEAWGNIGNRAYSSWYETHFLVENKGIFKLIYFKPKHFGRYTLFEVFSFFASFLFPIAFGILSILLSLKVISNFLFFVIVGSACMALFISSILVIIVNDIGSYKDDKKRFNLEMGERELQNGLEKIEMPGKHKENKLIKNAMSTIVKTRNNPYFTIYNLRDSYYRRIKKANGDEAKIEKINREYIDYFKNIDNLIVIKENKDGTLVFKQ